MVKRDKDYLPYICREDAIEEYKTLRTEILESQKQRINLFQYSIILIAALFGYLIEDGILPQETLVLVMLSIAPSLFSYSTRVRERRIANYLSTYLKVITPWSGLSSGSDSNGLKLKFFQRTSTTIILSMLLLDCVLLYLGRPNDWSNKGDKNIWIVALLLSLLNIWIAWQVNDLRDYKVLFKGELKKSEQPSVIRNEKPNATGER